MAQFTVILDKRVIRVNAPDIAALVRSLRASNHHWKSIHEDKE